MYGIGDIFSTHWRLESIVWKDLEKAGEGINFHLSVCHVDLPTVKY